MTLVLTSKNILKCYNETGLSKRFGKHGRKHKSTIIDNSILIRKSKENFRLTNFDMQKHLLNS